MRRILLMLIAAGSCFSADFTSRHPASVLPAASTPATTYTESLEHWQGNGNKTTSIAVSEYWQAGQVLNSLY